MSKKKPPAPAAAPVEKPKRTRKTTGKATKATAKPKAKAKPTAAKKSVIKKPLAPQHEQFIEHLVEGKTQTEAYRLAFPESSPDSARTSASRLLTNDNITEELEKRRKIAALSANVTKAEVIGAVSEIAFANISDCFDDFGRFNLAKAQKNGADRFIKSISTSENKYGETVKVEFYSRMEALKTLGDWLGLGQKEDGETKTIETVARNIHKALKIFPAADVAQLIAQCAEEYGFSALALKNRYDELLETENAARTTTAASAPAPAAALNQ